MVYFCHLSTRTAAPLSASISDLFYLGSQEVCAYKMVVGATVVARSLGGLVPDRMLTLSTFLWYSIIFVNVVILVIFCFLVITHRRTKAAYSRQRSRLFSFTLIPCQSGASKMSWKITGVTLKRFCPIRKLLPHLVHGWDGFCGRHFRHW